MPEDDILKFVGGIISLLFIGFIFALIFGSLNDLQCQSYKDTINQRDSEISRLNGTINLTNYQLGECNDKYEILIKENITKKDIEEIKSYYNQTQLQINYLDQKFESVNNNFQNTYNLFFKQYKISIALNIFFLVDLISFAFFKVEFVTYLFSLIFKRDKKNKIEDKKE